MNIFYLNDDPVKCAQDHCDKHVVKMIIEYAQLMSTAHRMLDGEVYEDRTKNNRRIKRWLLHDDREHILYKASHINHPSAIWARQSTDNYQWLYQLFTSLCDEYTHRYGKVHKTDTLLRTKLSELPTFMRAKVLTEVPQAMPDYCKMPRAIDAYRNYYIKEKVNFAKWTKRMTPEWFKNAVL
jgi:hypothetical protein